MSLLLDALRRAAAAKQGPAGDRHTVPRRGDRTRVPTPAAAEGPGEETGPAPAGDDAVDLELELRDDDGGGDQAQASREARAAGGGTGADSGDAAAARAVLHAGGRRGGERVRAVLALGAGVLVLGAAFATGTWYYYRVVYTDVTRELASFRPEAQPESAGAATGADDSTAADAGTAGDAATGDAEMVARVEAEGAARAGSPRPGADAADAGTDAGGAGAGDDAQATASGQARASEGEAAEVEEPGETTTQQASAPAADEDTTAGQASAPADGDEQAATPGDSEAAEAGETTTRQASAPADGGDTATRQASAPADTGETTSAGAREPAAPQPRSAQPMVQASEDKPLGEALQSGYQALQGGDLESAADAYRRARRLAPDNRDALLGAAAVARRRGDPGEARALYQRILRDHPRDPWARSGVASLDGGRDPRRSESELKLLLRERPGAASLHYELGNVYAADARWAEAQEAYFEAVRAAPEDAAYAYNLAVALDHLGQRDAARRYYEQALRLADGRQTGVPLDAAERRLRQLR